MPDPITPGATATPGSGTPAATPPGGTPGATPTPGATTPGAPGTATPAIDAQKQVPIHVLHDERDKRQALQAELDSLKSALQTHQPAPQAPVQQPVGIDRKQLDEMWENDPRKAMQTELMMAVNWYDKTNTQLNLQKGEVMNKHADYGKYNNKVDAYLANLPLEQRSKPGVVELAYFAVKGQNAESLEAEITQKIIDKIKRGEQVQGLGAGTIPAPATTPQQGELTQEQLNAAAAMNVSPEEYMKYVKK
jgi:hypothetical protein